MNSVKCAPIIIPTLNRVNHLKRCIDSLKKNQYACDTDLIISVDFPPNESYIKGYEDVLSYLNKGVDGFRNVEIFFQERNRGPFGEGSNGYWLIEYASLKYDRFIFTEDDNEFSPYFLKYMNEYLTAYETHEKVMFVCAEGLGKTIIDKGVVKVHDFSAYGVGIWKEKYNRFFNLKRDDILYIASDTKFLIRLAKDYKYLLFELQNYVLCRGRLFDGTIGEVPLVDIIFKLYNLYYEKYSIFLEGNSLVKNWGYDGTGVNCGDNKMDISNVLLENRPIPCITSIDDIDIGVTHYPEYKSDVIRAVVAIIRIRIWFLWNSIIKRKRN